MDDCVNHEYGAGAELAGGGENEKATSGAGTEEKVKKGDGTVGIVGKDASQSAWDDSITMYGCDCC